MRTNVSTKTFWVTLFACLACPANAQDPIKEGDNSLINGKHYALPIPAGEENSNAVYYLPDFFKYEEGKGYKFMGKSGNYAIGIYKKTNGYQEKDGPIKNYYMQIWPKDGATGEDQYSCIENNFGAIWVSGINDGLPNYTNYSSDWDAWDTFAMAETSPKIYEMTLTLGQELGPNAAVKFWFHNFQQDCYRDDKKEAQYGKNINGWDNEESHRFEFRGNKPENAKLYVPLLKMEDCDFLTVSIHTPEIETDANQKSKLPQYGNGNMGGIEVKDYSNLPNLPVSTKNHTYKYKFTIDLNGVNSIWEDHQNEVYVVKVENVGDPYKLKDPNNDTYDDLDLDTEKTLIDPEDESKGYKHTIPLRDAMRFQGGILYKNHFAKKFNKLAITGYLNKDKDIAFLKKIGNNIKILDLSEATIEGNSIPDSLCFNSNDLEEVFLPASLQSIGSEAFSGCKNLKKVYVKSNNAENGADASAFSKITRNKCELVFANDVDGNKFRNGGWMNILTKDIYENSYRETDKNYDVCHQAHANVILHRQFTGKWETIVLPFDVDKKQIRTKEGSIDHASYFYGYQGNATSGNISFINVHHKSTKDQEHTFKAGSPFLLRIINDYISPANDSLTFENVETYASDKLPDPKDQSITKNGLTFVGTFNATPKDKDKLSDIFALKEGKFVHATNASMKGYRAWFEKATNTQSAKALTFTEVDGNNTTAIIGIGNDGSLAEAFDIYNINGQLVQKNAISTDGLPKGIYIVNHKKIVVK